MKRGSHFKCNATFAVIAAALIAVVTYLNWDRNPEIDGPGVPLGVEQAAIVTYSGPRLSVAPYKWGVAVNVRIAEVTEQPDRRIYDMRYIVNRAGTFDLRDFLVAADGSELKGLPAFQIIGDSKLSKDLDTRIEETEELRIDVGGHYYETMALLFVLWIVWLLLLIFYKRPRTVLEADAAPAGLTLPEMLRDFMTKLEAGALTADDKARMEMLLLRCWRDDLALDPMSMRATLNAIWRDDKTASSLRKLQHWLHHPASPVAREEIAALIAPFAADTNPREEVTP
ncbi:hypothetical protein N9A78_00900 [Akkermansiaceae bacterium]|jgi:hypothetical protein|nr:hypothetical protein [Akkermansiaceae bacterium]